jgi:hypothetical protein
MNAHPSANAGAGRDTVRTIVAGGLLAGALDLAWAAAQSVIQGRSPGRMLQAIASGLLGADAFDAGAAAQALGVLSHFTIATGACATYVLACRRWPALQRRWYLAGPLFGVAVYFFMQLVVLPLSRVPWKGGFTPLGLTLGLAAHILCVGLPIAWVARRFAVPHPAAPAASDGVR